MFALIFLMDPKATRNTKTKENADFVCLISNCAVTSPLHPLAPGDSHLPWLPGHWTQSEPMFPPVTRECI